MIYYDSGAGNSIMKGSFFNIEYGHQISDAKNQAADNLGKVTVACLRIADFSAIRGNNFQMASHFSGCGRIFSQKICGVGYGDNQLKKVC